MKQYLIILFSLLLLTSCGNGKEKEDMPTLTVSIEPLRYFTEAIAGDKYKVVSMVPNGSNPETYDPTPLQLVTLAKSKAYLRIGYIGFEQSWIDKLKENAPELPFFDTSEGINLISDKMSAHHGHAHAGGIEPHVWNSAQNARVIADNIRKILSSLDNDNADYYRQRTDSLLTAINNTDKQIRARLLTGDTTFLIYHPALSYFARDYGLTQISIEDGGKEPSPAQLQSLIRRCKERKVHTIFIQQEFDTRNARLIAKELGIRIVQINPLSYEWHEEMLKVAETLGN